MSRKRAARSRESAPRPRDRRPRTATGRTNATRGIGVAVAVVVAAATAWIALGNRWPGTAPAATPADPIAALAPRAALQAGIELGNQGQNARSVPYFRRAADGLPGYWQARYDLSSALANSAVESHMRLGRLDPALRSSAERVGALVESERELVVAITQANGPHDRAVLLVARSQTYLAWGMPVDALALLRQAHDADPAWDQPTILAGQIAQGLALGGLER